MKPAYRFERYLIDENGRVYDQRNGLKEMSVRIHKNCPVVSLYDINGKPHIIQLARLILLTFCNIQNPERFEVHHLDKNKLNNKVSNLIWVTPAQHRYLHSLMRNQSQKELNFGDFIVN